MAGTELELELRERLLIQGDTFLINRNSRLTEQVNKKVAEALQQESAGRNPFASAGRMARRTGKRRKRSKLSNYSYYLQTMEENKFPLEKLPENTRFKRVKQMLLRVMNLAFQYQQQFNKAAEDVMIMMARDMKSMDMRQQGLEDKLETRVMDLLVEREEEIHRLKETVEELKGKQAQLEAELSQCETGSTDTERDV